MRRYAFCLLLTFLLCACMPESVVKDHLDVVRDTSSCQASHKALVVLLPGIYDTPDDLVREGFIRALRERHVAADVIAADTHFGYFRTRTVVDRLHEDIILPAREAGYEKIWLAGISLGGFGSLLYAKFHGEMIDGIFLMAPYLGEDKVLSEISQAKSLAAWRGARAGAAEYDRDLWTWLQGYTRAEGRTSGYPPLYLGYGESDRFAASNRLLGDALPPSHVATTQGGHDWGPWLRLWNHFLAQGLLPACA